MANPTNVQQISEYFIKPQNLLEEAKQPHNLTQWDIVSLFFNYIQKGLLFPKPQDFKILDFLEKLKHSLALTLGHFYPLAGRLVTSKNEQDPSLQSVYVDCVNSPGARLIHSTGEITISDIISPIHVPTFVQSLFDHDGVLNYEGHVQSLLTIQVTELVDGIFIGCSMNHCIADGSTFWHFLNTFSEIFQEKPISRPPVINPWFPDGIGPRINIPSNKIESLINRAPYEAPPFENRMFHFSSESIAKLKAKANAEYNTDKISSFQSLCALIWRCITRVRNPTNDQQSSCWLSCNNRSRMKPPLSEEYFGNCIFTLRICSKASELLENNLGWAAWQVNQAVVNHSNEKILEWVNSWCKNPNLYHFGQVFDPYSVMIGGYPWFNSYGNEFGLGKAVSLRSGRETKMRGKVSVYGGQEGGGSADVEVCLSPDTLIALESDEEFMAAVF